MTITIPGSLQWVAYLVGEEWPEGDEDAMKRLGSGWRTSSGELKDIVPDLNRIKEEIRASFSGESADAVDKVFKDWFEGDYALDKLSEAMDGLADLSDAHAMQVQYTKLMILTSLGIAAVEIAFALASAWATFGGSLGTIPIIEALTTMAVRQAMSQLLRQIVEKLAEAGARTAIKQLVKEFGETVAKQAAKKAAERVARQVARSTAQKIALGASRVAANVVFETAIGVGQEVGIQAYQINDGMRDKFNTGQIRDTAISSAAGALGGQATAFGAGKLLKNTPLGQINNTAAGRFTSGAVTGYSAGVVGNLAGTGALWVGNRDTQFTALSIFGGASSGALSGGVHGGLGTHAASAGDTGNSGHNGGTGTTDHGGNSSSESSANNNSYNGSQSNSEQNGSPSHNGSTSNTTESGSSTRQQNGGEHSTAQHSTQQTGSQPHETNGSQAGTTNGSTPSHPNPAAAMHDSAVPSHPNVGDSTTTLHGTTEAAPHTPTGVDTQQPGPSGAESSSQSHTLTNTEGIQQNPATNADSGPVPQHQNQQAASQQPAGTQPAAAGPAGTQPSATSPSTTHPSATTTTHTSTTSTPATTAQSPSSTSTPAHTATPGSQATGAPTTHRADSAVTPVKAPESAPTGQQVTSGPESTRTQPTGTSNDKAGPVVPQTRSDAPQQVRSDSSQNRTDTSTSREPVGPERSTPERGDNTRSSDPSSTDKNTQVNDDARADDGRVKLSGHGTYNPENGTVTVPKGTSVTVYAEHGARITDGLGNRIETGQDVSGVYSRTYTEGEVMPNYTLHPPDGLDTQGTPHTVDRATNLRGILSEGMGPVDWAACVEAAVTPDGGDAPGRHKLYDTTRIGDKTTGETTYYRGPETDSTGDRHGDGDQTSRSPQHSSDSSHKSSAEHTIDSLEEHRTRQHEGATADDTRNAHDQAHAVREKWDALTPDEQRSLINHETQPGHQSKLGDLDGLPAHVRDTLNRHNLVEDMVSRHPKLEDQIREYANAMDDHLASPNEHPKPDHFDPTHDKPSALNRLAALFDNDIAPYRNVDATWRATYGVPDTATTPTRQLLAYDPKAFGGDGRIAVAVGDLDAARVVSVHTPGITSTIRSIDGNIINAENHHIRSNEQRPDQINAVIAWIGYDAPSGLGLARTPSTTLARLGGFRLAHDVAALAGTLSADTRINMFGHSYGSTTTAFAGQHGRLANYVDTVTLLGSPGAGPLHHASDFGIGAENVYVASNSHDLVTWVGGTQDGHFNRISGRLHLGGLGFDPAMREFGATRIAAEYVSPHHTDGLITAHVNYFSTEHFEADGQNTRLSIDPHARPTESLANFVHISTGDTHRLTLETPDPRTATPVHSDQHGRVGTRHDAATYRDADPPTGYPGQGQCVPSVLQDLGGSHVWRDALGDVGPEGATRGAFEAALGTHLREGTTEDIIAATQRGEQVVVVHTYDRAGLSEGHPGAHTFLVKPNPDDPAHPLVVDRQTGGAHPWPPRDLDRVTHADIAMFHEDGIPTHPMDPHELATHAERSTDHQRIGQTALETERGGTPEDGFHYPRSDEIANVGQDNPLTIKYPDSGDEIPHIGKTDPPEITYPKTDEIPDTGLRNTPEIDYPNLAQVTEGTNDIHEVPPEIDHTQTTDIDGNRLADLEADRPADINQARPADIDLNRPTEMIGDRPAEFGNDQETTPLVSSDGAGPLWSQPNETHEGPEPRPAREDDTTEQREQPHLDEAIYPSDHISNQLELPGYHPGSLSGHETRTVYLNGEQRMRALHDDMVARGVDPESRARAMARMRNELRTWARELMADRAGAAKLNRENPNHSWDDVVRRYAAEGREGRDLFERIVEKSTSSRQSVNEGLGIDPENPGQLPQIREGSLSSNSTRDHAHPPRGEPERSSSDHRDETHDDVNADSDESSDRQKTPKRYMLDDGPGEPHTTREVRPGVTERHYAWDSHLGEPGVAKSDIMNHPDTTHVHRTRIERDFERGAHGDFPNSQVREIEVTVGRNTAVFTLVDGHPARVDFLHRQTFDPVPERPSSETRAQGEVSSGHDGDDAGHMSAFRFTLDQEFANLFPQDANFNRGAFKTMENEWAAFIQQGGEVYARIDLNPPSERPDTVSVEYAVNKAGTDTEIYFNQKNFDNTGGQKFKRLTVDQIIKKLKKPIELDRDGIQDESN